MSVTTAPTSVSAEHKPFLDGHDQFKPFLLAVAIVAVSIVVALAFTGLPA
ncbi:MAG: hypothetical protein WDN25_21085 [Acetobacteraceae bacterium]